MINTVESHATDPQAWHASELMNALDHRRPLRALVLSGRPHALASVGIDSACSVHFTQEGEHRWHAVDCALDRLPFQLDVFDLVVLHELVSQDDERLLAGVRGAMPGGSQLLVLGCAHWSLAALAGKADGQCAFRPGWLRHRLAQFGFIPEVVRGRGVAGMDRVMEAGWPALFLPFCDQLVVQARRSDARPNVRLVRFSRPKAAVGRATVMEGANREVAS